MQIRAIEITDRGPTPRRWAKVYTAAARDAWLEAATYFHKTYTPRRFTEAHAKAAGYALRAGQDAVYGSKRFWNSYFGRKIRYKGHRKPLVWSGNTERAAKTATISSTTKRASIRFPGVRVLNWKPHLRDEFTRILPEEAVQLGVKYDARFTLYIKMEKRIARYRV